VAPRVFGENVEGGESLDGREVVPIARLDADHLPHCDPRRIACECLDAVASYTFALRLGDVSLHLGGDLVAGVTAQDGPVPLARTPLPSLLLPVVLSDGRARRFREPFADLS
jgi:hypothetical protein